MKILYLHPKSWSGEYPLLRKFVSLGPDVFVLAESRTGAGPARWVTDHYAIVDDAITTLWYDPSRGFEKLVTWPVDRFFKKSFEGRNLAHRMLIIRSAIARFSPDIVVASDGFSYAVPAAFLRRMGGMHQRFVVSYIGGDILDCPEAEVGKRRTRLTDWLIRSSVRIPDILRPVSPLMRRRLLDDGANDAHIRVIPSHLVSDMSYLDNVFRQRGVISAKIRAQHGIADAEPVIVTLGGNQKGKGLQILVKAWQQVLAKIPQARWMLCGPRSRWLEDEILPMLSRLDLSSNVVVVGELGTNAVFDYLAAADLHVNPSLCESLNMATVEAAAVGTPSICSDGAGIADWIRRVGAGRVIAKGEVSELADAIISALSSVTSRSVWSVAGRHLALEFSLDRVSRDLLDCFKPASNTK